jgi:hypothetical protein
MGAYGLSIPAHRTQHQPFTYDDDRADELIGAMSPARFRTYREASETRSAALALYTWNTATSAAFYGPLQSLEITLRNAIHSLLSTTRGSRWFDDDQVLRPAERRKVGDATRHLYELGRQPTPGRVVAELPFGFWVALFANAYDTTIWRTDLHKLFTPRVKHRQGLHDALDRLRTLRNRIAHHEPIFQRNLHEDYRRIRNLVGFLSQPTLAWLDHHSTVPSRIDLAPGRTTTF